MGRMALLYVAKKNSDSFQTYLSESGKKWTSICFDSGTYALHPNAPFDLDHFLMLPDDVLEEYGCGVGKQLSVHKAPQGSVYRYQAVELATTAADELMGILSDKPQCTA